MASLIPPIEEKDLRHWNLLADFKASLARVWPAAGRPARWQDPRRLLQAEDYLCLFLFGLVNPTVRTMRGLCAASELARLQAEVCTRRVSLGSFSEAQHLLDPAVLEKVFNELAQAGAATRPQWLIQDSSLFNALPRMHWALWRRQGKTQAQVRLHLSLDVAQGSPARATITTGRVCERRAWQRELRPGDGYVADRYYGEDYRLLEQLDQKGVAFVVRLRDQAVMAVEEELPLGPRDQAARVLDDAWVRLGCKPRYQIKRLRLVRVDIGKEVLLLLTNLAPGELSAAEVALLYKERWQVELFFRWIKYVLGCRHWLAESAAGAAIELYLALIGGLLLHRYSGQRPSRRRLELLQLYMLGIATPQELERALQRAKLKAALRTKKS